MKPSRGNEEDSWESLAENLFGVEFTKHDDVDELISADELFPEEAESRAEEELVRDESTGEGRAGELAEEVDADQAQPVAAQGDSEDQYWDALREWASDVGESDEESRWSPTKGKRKKDSRRGEERAPAAEDEPLRQPSAAADEPEVDADEFLDDSDFAAGLIEDEPRRRRPKPPAPKPVTRREEPVARREDRREEPVARREEAEPDDDSAEPFAAGVEESDEERPRRRRRRRGRRAPGAEGEARTADVARDEPDEDVEFGRLEEEPERAEPEESDEERRERRRPRRRRGGRPEREELAIERTPQEQSEEEEVLVDWSAEPILDSTATDEDEDEDEREAVGVYRDIPTWEEAISCLLNPSASESSRRESERERSSGREGGGRRRRRRR